MDKNRYEKCPFYKKDDAVSIRCEGLVEKSTLVQQFNTKKSRENFQNQFCRTRDYKKCPIHKMLMQKYSER